MPSAISTGVVPAGIEHQEVLAPLPDPLLDQAHVEAVFAERQADEARMRAERMMKQRVACSPC